MAVPAVKRRYVSTIFVFLLALVLLAASMDRDLNIFDEGIILANVMLVHAGEVIHRDFYSLYGPATFYIISTLFHVSAAKFLMARIYGLVVMAGIVALTFETMAGRMRRSVLTVTTICCGLLLFSSPFYLYPLFPCLLLALAGSLLLIGREAISKPSALAGAGACAGAAAYFRYDTGFFLLLSHLLAVAVLLLLRRPPGDRLRPLMRAVFLYGGAAGLVFLLGAIIFASVSPLSAFITDIVEYSTKYYAEMRGMPFPSLREVYWSWDLANIYLPLVAVAAAGFEMWRRSGADREAGKRDGIVQSCLVVFAILAAGLYYKGVVRVSALHLLMSIVPGMILLAICADAWWTRGGLIARASAIGAMLIIVVPSADAARREINKDLNDPARSLLGWLMLPAADVEGASHAAGRCPQPLDMWPGRLPFEYSAVSNYLRTYTRPDERIWVGLDRHDKIFANPEALYFAAQRLPATRWHEFDPGLQNRADMQLRMIDELRGQKTRWVVRDSSFSDIVEPNGSRLSTNVHLLDHYLDTEFRQVAAAGRVTIWLRNGVQAPSSRAVAGKACMPVVMDRR